MMWLMLWSALAWAETPYVVRRGDTLESIAEARGDATLPARVRAALGLSEGGQPKVGTRIDVASEPGVRLAAYVVSKNGTGEVTLPTGRVVPLETCQALPVDSKVCTGAEAVATLRLSVTEEDPTTGDDLTLFENTCITIVDLSVDGANRASTVDLDGGSVRVGDAAPEGGQVLVSTKGSTTVGAKGFVVERVQREVRTSAVRGAVEHFSGGEGVAVQKGQGTRSEDGKPPEPPRALPSKTELVAPLDGTLLQRPSFSWEPRNGVMGWFFEVAADPEFTEVLARLSASKSDGHEAFPWLLPLHDRYHWRVIPVDPIGLVGEASDPWRFGVPQMAVAP